MAKNLDPKCKQCRREGQKLFLKGERCNTPKCAIIKRNYAPGLQGNKRRARLTGYGVQLREKQRAKRLYGVLERQFRLYYERAKAKQGKTGDEMLIMLESRLDNAVYRSGLAPSRSKARQLVSHAHFQVNGKNVNIPSYQVSAGDVVTVKDTKKEQKQWKEISKEKNATSEVPAWLQVDRAKLAISIQQLPSVETIQSDLQIHLIVELYSL